MYLDWQFWALINEMSKVYYEETQKNETKHVLIGPGNSCSINFCNLQGKHPCGSFF